MPVTPAQARRLWQLLEPVHAVTYFATEPLTALREAGYRGYWMGYFAQRAAALGPVGPSVVHALFFNFSAERVARALPSAWQLALPEAALDARLGGSVAALRRELGALADDDRVARAADLAARAAATASPQGRALFAAHQALPWPQDPVGRLWHAATLLREHRGDGHVAVLLAAGVGGREAHVLHALAARTPRAVYETARELTAQEWDAHLGTLTARGLAADGALSRDGVTLAAQVEGRTDSLAAGGYAALTPEEADELGELLVPVTRAVVGSGDIPLDTPVGLDLRTVAL